MPNLYMSLRTSSAEMVCAWNESEINSESPADGSFGSSGPSEDDDEREEANEVALFAEEAVVKLGSCLIRETR